MSDEPFPRAVSGDPLRIPASAWNRMRDATIAYERNRMTGVIRGGVPNPTEVLLKNTTATDRARYDVMAIDGPLFGPTDNLTEFQTNLCLQGIEPDFGTHSGRWAVLMEPLAAGQIGRAVISGDTICLMDINSAGDTHVDLATGDYRLQGARIGPAQILWKESGTGADKYAIIRFGNVRQSTFMAEITGSTLIAGHQARWLYNIAEVNLVPTFSYSTLTGCGYTTMSGGRTGLAINRRELSTIAEPGGGSPWYVGDTDVHGTSYAATAFGPVPIGGGGTSTTHKQDQVVEVTEHYDVSAAAFWYSFGEKVNHDGNCS